MDHSRKMLRFRDMRLFLNPPTQHEALMRARSASLAIRIKKPGIYYTLSPLFWSKKDCSVKIDSDFESIFDVLFDGVNQNYILLFLHAKKIGINM